MILFKNYIMMKTITRINLSVCALVFLFILAGCTGSSDKNTITLESLLDEMVSVEEQARFPDPYYICLQESSYDRSSVTKDQPGWFANNDGFGIMRTDTVNGRIEKVMFNETGPGVITRIWITTIDKRGTWRFYFDGAEDAELVIPGYDLMRLNIPGAGRGFIQPHTSYTPDGKGGNTSFLPIPYAKGCKITFEDSLGVQPTPKYYHINYRKYSPNVSVETFSRNVAQRAKQKISEVNDKLLHPAAITAVPECLTKEEKKVIPPSGSMTLELPEGENSLYEINFTVHAEDSSLYAQTMREVIFVATFDNKQTVWVPLSDFSGGGMGAPYVDSWFLSSDGNGKVTSRWLMPYKQSASVQLLNISAHAIEAGITARIAPLKWDDRSLYFHASWRQEDSIYIHNNPEEADKCIEWNFATIQGKGVYKGDLLSLFNHAPRWYGEGDEKIWIDDDLFPSHFGTGTEDYYNSSWAPVVPFHTPFGGAPRADMESSHGYNAFFRTRNLDGIPFKKEFKFDIEMLGWDSGYVDYATTIYWYGDYQAKAIGTSGIEEAQRPLLPTPPNPAEYKTPDSIEFEDLPYSAKSPEVRTETQSMQGFTGGKWSKAKQMICPTGKPGDFIEYTFDDLKENKYKLTLYATQANDYGIITFYVNGQPVQVSFDGYNETVSRSKPICLGTFAPQSEKLKLKVEIKGANPKAVNGKYLVGLDCIQIVPEK